MFKFLCMLIFSASLNANANLLQSQKIQFQCKEKAKEIAQSTYTTCLNGAREIELDKVKLDYKEKMEKLKSYYDKKIKSLSPSESEASSTSKAPTAQTPVNLKPSRQGKSSEASALPTEDTDKKTNEDISEEVPNQTEI